MSSVEERTQQWIHVPNDPNRDVSQIRFEEQPNESMFDSVETMVRGRPGLSLVIALVLGVFIATALIRR